MKTAALARDQTDGRLVMTRVVVADSKWSSNDGGESHGGLDVLMEVACSSGFLKIWSNMCRRWRATGQITRWLKTGTVCGTWLGYGTGVGALDLDVQDCRWATVSMYTVRIRTQEAMAGWSWRVHTYMHHACMWIN